MSKGQDNNQNEVGRILAKGSEAEQELLETADQRIDDLVDEKLHYSLDILHVDSLSVKIGVYGVEGYDLPEKKTVAKAVAEQFDWTPAFEEKESMNDYYEIRVVDWEESYIANP